ncbi:unnamed protein product [Rotaria sp. Silwood1]|nr:unnamed protein product [Rotaria sp. Silwood1]CAF1637051.1 unnamed protein product [Rotaria sp. Silwood1]CAF3821163.1 unnamed protein product [Rotaria sp. Silwood1]CAF3924218.1 unnamed protein product [Rotaria sp. Silwood1]
MSISFELKKHVCNEEYTVFLYISGSTILRSLLTNQITHLNIEIKDETIAELCNENKSNIFPFILSLSKQLIDLTFSEMTYTQRLGISTFNLSLTSCISSTLIKLKIDVNTFDDCLYLLDGRLECLSILIVKIREISMSLSKIDNTVSSFESLYRKLLKLNHFSLISVLHTIFYDAQVVPLLQRMTNLEELTLFISVLRSESTYIDGNYFYDEILVHMPRLNKFTFNIITEIVNANVGIVFPLNDDIQFSFKKRGYHQVGSYSDYNPTMGVAKCHVYSLPYQFELFIILNNFFPGGMFNKVRYLTMNDTSPFEHELFKLVSQDFPYLENLYICNFCAQENKQDSSTLIVFPHLIALKLGRSHINYAEQFLFEKNTRLPRLRKLTINYKTLEMVTDYFTNDAMRLNCANLQSIDTDGPFVRPKNFHQYFPLL